MQSQFHPTLRVARRGLNPVETRGWRGCGSESSADVHAGNARYIGEASDTSDDGRRSAGALEFELLDVGLTGGGLEAEQRGGIVHYAGAPAGLEQGSQDMLALGVWERAGAAGPTGPRRVEPSPRMTARSISFRNSRTLTGHG
jgi:hypothetical protein